MKVDLWSQWYRLFLKFPWQNKKWGQSMLVLKKEEGGEREGGGEGEPKMYPNIAKCP